MNDVQTTVRAYFGRMSRRALGTSITAGLGSSALVFTGPVDVGSLAHALHMAAIVGAGAAVTQVVLPAVNRIAGVWASLSPARYAPVKKAAAALADDHPLA